MMYLKIYLVRLYNFLINKFFFLVKKSSQVFKSTTADLLNNKILDDSASMSYSSLMSIIPLIIMVFPILNSFGVAEDLINSVKKVLISNMELDDNAAKEIIEYFRNAVLNGTKSGFYSFIIYSFSSVLLVNKIKNLFDKIFRINPNNRDRNIVVKFLKYILYIISFAVIVAFVCFLRTYLFSTSNKLNYSIVIKSNFIKNLIFFTAIILIFFLIFKVMSSVYISSKSALICSLFFTFELILLNFITNFFIHRLFVSMGEIYGVAVDFIIALIWVNLFWKSFIVAVDLAYIIQYKPIYEKKSSNKNILIYIQNSIEIINLIIIGFKEGRGGEKLQNIVSTLSITNQEAIELCDIFIENHLIHSVGKLKNRLYAPAIPTNEITVYNVIKAIQGESMNLGVSNKVIDRICESEMKEFLTTKIEEL